MQGYSLYFLIMTIGIVLIEVPWPLSSFLMYSEVTMFSEC